MDALYYNGELEVLVIETPLMASPKYGLYGQKVFGPLQEKSCVPTAKNLGLVSEYQ